jgi:hypothetical protein
MPGVLELLSLLRVQLAVVQQLSSYVQQLSSSVQQLSSSASLNTHLAVRAALVAWQLRVEQAVEVGGGCVLLPLSSLPPPSSPAPRALLRLLLLLLRAVRGALGLYSGRR